MHHVAAALPLPPRLLLQWTLRNGGTISTKNEQIKRKKKTINIRLLRLGWGALLLHFVFFLLLSLLLCCIRHHHQHRSAVGASAVPESAPYLPASTYAQNRPRRSPRQADLSRVLNASKAPAPGQTTLGIDIGGKNEHTK